MSSELEEGILIALRRITRAIALHSRYLANTFGLTGPQLVCLRELGHRGRITPSELARHVALSQATVTGIVDRLVARQLVRRERSEKDRRLVSVELSGAGRRLLEAAPSALQEVFVRRLTALSPAERATIRATLEKVADMMDAEGLPADPVLSTSAVAPQEIEEPVDPHLRHREDDI